MSDARQRIADAVVAATSTHGTVDPWLAADLAVANLVDGGAAAVVTKDGTVTPGNARPSTSMTVPRNDAGMTNASAVGKLTTGKSASFLSTPWNPCGEASRPGFAGSSKFQSAARPSSFPFNRRNMLSRI